MFLRKLRRLRRGTAAVQWAIFAAVIMLIVIGSVRLIGTESSEHLEETSGGVGDPSELVNMID